MKIGFVGGGSGGHFYPLIAVAEVLQAQPDTPDLYYFGPSPYNKEALATYNITYVPCPAGKLRRYFSLQNFFDIFRTFFGFFVALYKLFIVYPDVIFSKGGYTSVPVLQAARLLRIPVVIHESDAVPGKANKLAASFARYIGISYDDVARHFPSEKTALTGIPLRKEIIAASERPFEKLGIPADKPLIYITGGSLGADRLNNVVLDSLDELLPHFRIFHQTGTAHYDELLLAAQTLLKDSPLIDDYYIMGSIPAETVSLLYDAAAVVVTRAGSTTLFEIAAHGKPAIIVPIPEDVSRDQRTNAFAYAGTGAASVIEQQNLTSHLLTDELQTIINDPNRTAAMSAAAQAQAVPDAAQKIAAILYRIGKEHE